MYSDFSEHCCAFWKKPLCTCAVLLFCFFDKVQSHMCVSPALCLQIAQVRWIRTSLLPSPSSACFPPTQSATWASSSVLRSHPLWSGKPTETLRLYHEKRMKKCGKCAFSSWEEWNSCVNVYHMLCHYTSRWLAHSVFMIALVSSLCAKMINVINLQVMTELVSQHWVNKCALFTPVLLSWLAHKSVNTLFGFHHITCSADRLAAPPPVIGGHGILLNFCRQQNLTVQCQM